MPRTCCSRTREYFPEATTFRLVIVWNFCSELGFYVCLINVASGSNNRCQMTNDIVIYAIKEVLRLVM
ncbi:hypothetical protein ATCV1_z822L [Acanthocystis turfacea chlorella virus 1]|uniref:Uncharacterized protein z822L n=1 Tax=Chlorovirus heliozoae TaxID=322019 RepID=A7KA82_9PHYC|nr:hypothetical protein ATCV1_z822L [Acanthocystis turfacea chlorella virus 1]ABT16956.1 hypothetical protein ATCV1_z822L [Acanthocystis turfacea chlorella virus 1]